MSGLTHLQGHGYKLAVLPEHGGLLASLSYDNAEILRPLPPRCFDPLLSASFPLVPFANRIAGGRFSWMGSRVKLPANFSGETSAIHGFGWQSRWVLEEVRQSHCILSHEWQGLGPQTWPEEIAGWPWAYRAEQHISLGEEGCSVTLILANRSETIMPAGLGLHPYFRRRPESRLTFGASHVCETGPQCLPNGKLAPVSQFGDFASGAELPDVSIDHCFTNWGGVVMIQDDLGTIKLSATGARHLHLFAPVDAQVLCLEPVSHTPDALNQNPADVPSLQPGEKASLKIRICAQTS